jgi:glyoxylase-like metal-dependent hydrolase (beta-lactamase superfamily II)
MTAATDTNANLPITTDGWWHIERVDDTITHLIEPHVDELLRCNVWHVRGRDRDLLIDTGMGISSLAAAGSELFEKDLVVVLTHTHADHMGGWWEFDDRRVHVIEAPRLRPDRYRPDLPSLFTADLDHDEFASLETAGYRIPSCFITALPEADYDPAAFCQIPAEATTVLEEGDVVDLGDHAFEVLHLPGHSPGSIGLWDSASGVLFSGDAIYDGPLLDELPGSDIADYLTTMHRLRQLPVSVVHGGHDPSFGADRLIELADEYIRSRT